MEPIYHDGARQLWWDDCSHAYYHGDLYGLLSPIEEEGEVAYGASVTPYYTPRSPVRGVDPTKEEQPPF